MRWPRFRLPPRPITVRASFLPVGPLVGVLLALGVLTLIVSTLPLAFPVTSATYTILTPPPASPTTVPISRIARENQLPGTTDWAYSRAADRTLLQGYTGVVSAVPGQRVPVAVSAIRPVMYHAQLFRLGWYGGTGGRLMAFLGEFTSQAQGYWTPQRGLVGCITCQIDAHTHLLDAQWATSFVVTIDATWPSGLYAIKLTASLAQAEAVMPLVVRDDSGQAPILANLPVNSYQAYNAWGGYNLYGNDEQGSHATSVERATQVSFNRPLLANGMAGAGDWLSWDIHTVRWLERAGAEVSYTTDVDLSNHPASWLAHRSVLVLGHDEYWTKAMRDGAETARAAGVNLGFLGANDAYWQARLAPDLAGQVDRTLTCYKVESASKGKAATLATDPLAATQPQLVTAQWRDAALARPENSLIGIMYHSYIRARYYPAWVVSGPSTDPYLQAAGLRPQHPITGGLVGYEYDALFANGQTPAGLVTLATSPVRNIYGVWQTANTTYYRAASGALVFAAGTIWWAWGLDEMNPVGAAQRNVLGGNQHISDLMIAFLRGMDPTLQLTPPHLATIP